MIAPRRLPTLTSHRLHPMVLFLRLLEPLRRPRQWALGAAALLAAVCLLAAPAWAATWTVNTTTDPSSGLASNCTSGNSDTCSLRDAITAANADSGDTIVFDSTVFAAAQTITLTSQLPTISTNMTITGPGASLLTISGNKLYRVLEVTGGSTSTPATVSGLTIANGFVSGGANGGGIVNEGTLTLSNCSISGNTASGGSGGGLYSNGTSTTTLSNCIISGNTATNGGGFNIMSPLINDSDTLTLNNSTVSGNTATNGGGFYSRYSRLTLNKSTVSGNSASSDGGGFNTYADSLTVSNSTVADNSATDEGGGIYIEVGGEISFTISNSTVSGNTAIDGAGIFGAPVQNNCIVAGNYGTGTETESNGSGYGNNNITSATGLNLSPLGWYGGPTQTMVPLSGSTALNAGVYVTGESTTDQRGATRPSTSGATIDAGAVQVTGNTPTVGSVTPAYGPIAEETSVIITGTGLDSSTAAETSVSFGGTPGTGISITAATSSAPAYLTVTTPKISAAETVNITVTNGSGTSTTSSNDKFAYYSPLAFSLASTTFDVTYGTQFSQAFAVSGGSGSYTLSRALGTFPGGLTLTSSGGSGTLSGAPTGVGSFWFLLAAHDNTYTTATAAVQNYTVAVSQAALSVTASSVSASYGAAVPDITPSYSGWVNGDTSTALSTKPTCTATYTTTSAPGTYTTSCTGAAATNYSISYYTGTITVTQATPTINISNLPVGGTYGGSFTATYSYTGTGSPIESITSSTLSVCTVSGNIVSYVGVGTCTLTASATATTNYTAATGSQQGFTVSAATPTISISDLPTSGTYGGSFTATYSYTGTGSPTESITSSTLSVCTVSGNIVSYVGVGTCTLTASATATTNYTAATGSQQGFTVSAATPTISISDLPTSGTYGGSFTATYRYSGTGSPTESVSSSTPAVCTVSGNIVSYVGVGTCTLTASATATTDVTAATGSPQSFSVSAATLTIAATNASRVYGTTNPTFTGSVSGVVNNDSFTESFATTATALSAVGSYAIVPSVTGTNLANYTQSVNSGALTVTQAGTTTTLSDSTSTTTTGTNVTLTARVASTTSGTPTGSVSFYDNGGSTPVCTGTLNGTAGNDTASCTAALTAGTTNSLIATYNGDGNFVGSASGDASVAAASLDFTVTAPSTTTQTVVPGSAISYGFSIAPMFSNYAGTVTFSASGLPAGATATFSPASLSATSGAQTVTMTIQTAAANAQRATPSVGRKLIPVTWALLLLPLFGAKKMRRQGHKWMFCLLLLLGGIAATTTLSGCGSSYFAQAQKDYTVTVTATGGTLTHSFDVTLNVQ